MSLLWRRPESRELSWQDVWGSGGDIDRELIGRGDAALALVPMFAAHRVIIDAIASTPLHRFRAGADGTPERLSASPLWAAPPFGSAATWKGQAVASLLSDGNAFGFVTAFAPSGWPTQLAWLKPSEVTVEESPVGLPAYYWRGRRVESHRMVHIPWILPAGEVRAISPLRAFRLAWEMGQDAQRAAHAWFAGNAIPQAHLRNTTQRLSPEEAQAAKEKFRAAVRSRDVLVTGNDWSFDTIGVPADEARFIEGLKLSATQVAAIYGVPPEEIGGERGASLTYSTLEQDDLRFNGRTLRSWAVRLEEALTALMPSPQYAKFNLDANVRADLKTRMEAHEVAQRAGVLLNSEVRRLEDRAPLSPAEWQAWREVWHPARERSSTATREGQQ